MFSSTLSLHSSLNLRYHVLRPYSTMHICFTSFILHNRENWILYVTMTIKVVNYNCKYRIPIGAEMVFKSIDIFVLSVVLYGCEAWSLTLSKECRLRVFENRILRRICWHKRDENREWRRLLNEEFIFCTFHLI
jgi:hypothetical protein